MNGTDSEHLIDYFRNKKGKYLKLDNGEKVKLETVVENQYRLTLTFTHVSDVLVIPFGSLYGEYVTMHIPNGLQEGICISPSLAINSLKDIGHVVEHVLTNWTERKDIERKDEGLDLNWEEL